MDVFYMDYAAFFEEGLDTIKAKGHYRTFVTLERLCGKAPYARWHRDDGSTRDVIVFCSNDYLGMSQHPEVLSAFHKAADHYGVGAGGTRNISGTSKAHVELEHTIASLHQKERALLFSSGYTANKASLHILGSHIPDCVIFSDAKNHASIIHGIRNSRTHKHVFRHNDMVDLEAQLKNYPRNRAKIIAAVSVYSMDGDFAPLHALLELSKKYNALLFLDEVHAMGLYGPGGAGIAALQGLSDHVDILQGNFAKGYGVVGGYVASTNSIVDFIRSFAPGFIFTTSIPPAVAEACTASVKFLMNDNSLRRQLFYNVNLLKDALFKTSIDVIPNESHIVPIRVGDAHRCKKMSDALLQRYGFYVQPINYPTVPIGEERLRITVSPQHTEQHIMDFVDALHTLWKEFQCEKAA